MDSKKGNGERRQEEKKGEWTAHTEEGERRQEEKKGEWTAHTEEGERRQEKGEWTAHTHTVIRIKIVPTAEDDVECKA